MSSYKNNTTYERAGMNGGFARISNSLINDESIGVGAMSILVYLLAKTDTWNLNVKDLRRRFSLSATTVRKYIAELERAKYIRIEGRGAGIHYRLYEIKP